MTTTYRTVMDLDSAELEELKGAYFEQLQYTDDAYAFCSPYDIPDEVIFEHYEGVGFTNDDFSCNLDSGKMNRQKKLFIDGRRSGYAPDQCGETMTVGALREALNRAVERGDLTDDMPIYLANDHGYTYGEISDYNSFTVGADYESAEDFVIY